MDYRIFDRMRDLSFGQGETEDGQYDMERIFRAVFAGESADGKRHIYEMMECSFFGCSFAQKWLEVGFTVQEWELNPKETMHGGLIVTAVDMACGLLVRFFKRSMSAATVHLSVEFLRPLMCGEEFLVRAQINKYGTRIIFLTAEVLRKDDRETAATASGTFV